MPRRPTPRRPASPQPTPGFVAVASVRGPRGLRGELAVTPLTDFPERFLPGATLWASGVRYTVRGARPHRGALLLELDGIDSREQAERLRGLLLEVPEQELAPLADGQYYRFQLLGMQVFDPAGQSLGHIEEVLDTGANDVFIVRSPDGELLLPAIDQIVKEVDVANHRMVVELIEGLERRPLPRPRDDP